MVFQRLADRVPAGQDIFAGFFGPFPADRRFLLPVFKLPVAFLSLFPDALSPSGNSVLPASGVSGRPAAGIVPGFPAVSVKQSAPRGPDTARRLTVRPAA